ncbi:MAG: hypothetical protein AAF849_12020 [Bacteroidota bacterium]
MSKDSLANSDAISTWLNQSTVVEPTDGLLVIFFILYVASLVNERIVNFIKHNFPTLWMKSVVRAEENKRRLNIWLVSFFIGILISLILDIDLFETISKSDIAYYIEGITDYYESGQKVNILELKKAVKSNEITLKVEVASQEISKGKEFFVKLLGILITALFLSLGSKFWHDILDLVLFVKNARRKIQTFDPKGITKVDQIDQYLKEDEYKIARKALQANIKELSAKYKGASFNVGYEYIEKQLRLCIIVITRTAKKVEEISYFQQRNSLQYATDYGYRFRFPVIHYQLTNAAILPNSGNATAGGAIFNRNTPNNIGTFGCIVVDTENGEQYILTCYHCVKVEEQRWERFQSLAVNKKIIHNEIMYINSYNEKAESIGGIYAAYRDSRMDIALVKPQKRSIISDFKWLPNKTVPFGARKISEEDIEKRTKIWFSGKTSGISEAYIINFRFAEKIYYGDQKEHRLNNLIQFSKTASPPYERPCEGGDSGSILLDAETKEALGMIVAGDDHFGYAIPMYDILETNGLTTLNDYRSQKVLKKNSQ